MIDLVFKVLLLLFATATGYLLTLEVFGDQGLALFGLAGGATVALITILVGEVLKRSSLKALVGGILGLIVFLTPANFLTYFFFLNLFSSTAVKLLVLALVNFIFGYLGLVVGLHQAEGF